MPFRNLGILGSGSTSVRVAANPAEGLETLTGSVTSNTHADAEEGLRTLRQRHAGQYGADSQYDGHQSWHKVNPNPITSPVEGGTPTKKYDNDYVTHHIPRNDNQYSWIKESLVSTSSVGVNETTEFQKRGYGHRISWLTHATGTTVSFGSQVHPVFMSASDAGSFIHSTFNDRRFWFDRPKDLPQSTNINLNIVDVMSSSANTIGYPADVPLADSDETNTQYVNTSIIETVSTNASPYAFNSLMWLRGSQYGYNAWNQLRASDNLVTRHQRKENVITFAVQSSEPTSMGYPVVTIESHKVPAVDFTTQPGLVAIKTPSGNIKYIKYNHFDTGFGIDRVDQITSYVSSSNSWVAISDYLNESNSELVGVIYKETVFPAAGNQTNPTVRKRERFVPSFWAPYRDSLSASIDEFNLRASGRRVNKTGLLR